VGNSCLTACQELSRQRVGLASPAIQIHTTAMLGAARRAHVCRTADARDTTATAPAEDRGTGRASRGLETLCCGVGGEPKPAELQATQRRLLWRTGDVAQRRRWRTGAGDIEGARSRSHGPTAERPELGLGEPESMHRWTGTTSWAGPLACSDWSEERDVGRSRLDRVEGGGDNEKPGRTGRQPRCAVAGVLVCAVGCWT
jgi:hypothetical protein